MKRVANKREQEVLAPGLAADADADLPWMAVASDLVTPFPDLVALILRNPRVVVKQGVADSGMTGLGDAIEDEPARGRYQDARIDAVARNPAVETGQQGVEPFVEGAAQVHGDRNIAQQARTPCGLVSILASQWERQH